MESDQSDCRTRLRKLGEIFGGIGYDKGVRYFAGILIG